MKKDILILSDLWGLKSADWVQDYKEFLSAKYQVRCYDVQELAGIDDRHQSQEEIHQAFVTGGIDRAVQQLLQKEKGFVSILAFSIGGTIAWKAALAGLKVEELILLSATRIRYETEKPQIAIHLLYGEKDPFRPSKDWVQKMKITSYLEIPNDDHNFYNHFAPSNLLELF